MHATILRLDEALLAMMLSDRSQMWANGVCISLFLSTAAYLRSFMCPTGANNLKFFASIMLL